MKKQIAFYIGWYIVFFLIIFIYVIINSIALELFNNNSTQSIAFCWISMGLFAIMGAWITLLIFLDKRFGFSKKSATLGVIFIGIPAFYFAAYIPLSMSLEQFGGYGMPLYPYYLFDFFNSYFTIMANGFLVGYEVVIFAKRMIEFNRSVKVSEPVEPQG